MNNVKQSILDILQPVVREVVGEDTPVILSVPENEEHGDYSTNIPLIASKKMGKSPREIAEEIKKKLGTGNWQLEIIERIEIAGPGFINIWLSRQVLLKNLSERIFHSDPQLSAVLTDQKIMVEYAHPNTHKEMHIGHMRTLITGEAIARLAEAAGAIVFRANYQGDIGMHVAKAMFGIQKMISEQGLSIEELEKKSNAEKAHFLGQGYALGSSLYEEYKEQINQINTELYQRTGEHWDLYLKTRQWSLDYYEDFYTQFYTKYDRLFFESEMADEGVSIVKDHVGDIFKEDNGAVIFEGEKYGLHTRVFITQKGTPTYEAKDISNAYKQYEAFPFTKNIHVVASEQAGYFQVVFKALELLDPEKFKDTEFHLSMGMVQLKDRKMSSRTGEVFTVDSLIDDVRKSVGELTTDAKLSVDNKAEVIESITIAAIKYSVSKVGVGQDALFDIKSSVSLDGNSGPYLQYTYARTRSVLEKYQSQNELQAPSQKDWNINTEERNLLRALVYFPEIVAVAAEHLQPNILANYLYDLSQKFNLFYAKNKVIGSDQESFRIELTQAVGQTLKSGLNLLGIHTVEKM